jgi:succinate dehydrogenase / fumarate reductase cytochrome b subunit
VPDNAPGDMDRLARRFFSLSGLVPLGAFLVLHVVTNARALRGDAAFLAAARTYDSIPALPLVEALFVFAPLVFHGALGVWLVVTRRSFEPPVPYPRGVRIAMRATGVLTLAFLAMHLPELRFRQPGTRPSGGELLTVLASDMSSTWHGVPWRGVVYLAAAGCVAFHFAAGLWGFFVRSRSPGRVSTAAAWVAGAVGAVLWALLANVVVLHATGARLFGRARDDAPQGSAADPCPPPLDPTQPHPPTQ